MQNLPPELQARLAEIMQGQAQGGVPVTTTAQVAAQPPAPVAKQPSLMEHVVALRQEVHALRQELAAVGQVTEAVAQATGQIYQSLFTAGPTPGAGGEDF